MNAVTVLKKRDPLLAGLIEEIGPCRLERRPDGFASLTRSIVSQQVSKGAAASIMSKVTALFGREGPHPKGFLELPYEDLRKAGLSSRKVDSIRALAKSVLSGNLAFAAFEEMTDEMVIAILTSIKGIGRWTAEMYLIFSMNRLDVFPVSDGALRSAMLEIYGLDPEDFVQQAVQIAEAWRPYRTVACWYLYQYRNRKIKDGERGLPTKTIWG